MTIQSNQVASIKREKTELESRVKDYKTLVNMVTYEHPRIWRSKNGQSLQAILIQDDGTTVTLRTGREKLLKIPRNKLSKRDVSFLDQLMHVEKERSVVIPTEDRKPTNEDMFQNEIEEKLRTIL